MASDPPYMLVAGLPPGGGSVSLSGEVEKHARVLRLVVGDPLVLFDGAGSTAEATVLASERGRWICQAQVPIREAEPESPLTMIVGLTKGDKLDTVVRMLTELDVDRIVLALCERTVPDPRSPDTKRKRLERIGLSACAQARRARAPRVEGPLPLLEAAAAAPDTARRVVFWEQSRTAEPPSRAPGMTENRQIWAVVGPEGGLAEGEVRALEALGFVSAGLGRRILRAETAAVAAAALLTLRNA